MAAVENKLEIALALETMKLLGSLENDIPANNRPKIRDLLATLNDFQNRFAKPMFLPFDLGNDLSERLQTEKPIEVLVRNKVLVPVSGITVGPDDGVSVGNQTYVNAGCDMWKNLIMSGKLASQEAAPVIYPMPQLLKELFTVFELTAAMPKEIKNKARHLASCWYHIATQVDFTAQPQDEITDAITSEETAGLVQAFSATAAAMAMMSGALGGMGTGEEIEDRDGKPGELKLENFGRMLFADYNSEEDDDYDMDNEKDDEEEDDEGEKTQAQETGNTDRDGDTAMETNEDDDGDYREDENGDQDDGEQGDGENDEMPELSLDVPAQESEAAKVILRVVEVLNAYLPPATDTEWFKRVLKGIRSVQRDKSASKMHWYPWGCPPLEKMNLLAQSNDTDLKQFGLSVINLFQSAV